MGSRVQILAKLFGFESILRSSCVTDEYRVGINEIEGKGVVGRNREIYYWISWSLNYFIINLSGSCLEPETFSYWGKNALLYFPCFQGLLGRN